MHKAAKIIQIAAHLKKAAALTKMRVFGGENIIVNAFARVG
jgi:hypothetical protein